MNNNVIGSNDSISNESEVKLLDIQIVLNILFIIGIIINTFFAVNQRKSVNGEEPFIENKEAQKYIFYNKIFMFILTLGYLYITYVSFKKTKENNKNSTYLGLQLFSSFIITIVSLIPLYVAYKLTEGDDNNPYDDIFDLNVPDI